MLHFKSRQHFVDTFAQYRRTLFAKLSKRTRCTFKLVTRLFHARFQLLAMLLRIVKRLKQLFCIVVVFHELRHVRRKIMQQTLKQRHALLHVIKCLSVKFNRSGITRNITRNILGNVEALKQRLRLFCKRGIELRGVLNL